MNGASEIITEISRAKWIIMFDLKNYPHLICNLLVPKHIHTHMRFSFFRSNIANFVVSSIVYDLLLIIYICRLYKSLSLPRAHWRNDKRRVPEVLYIKLVLFGRECVARILHYMNLRQSDPLFPLIARNDLIFAKLTVKSKSISGKRERGPIIRCRAIDHRANV